MNVITAFLQALTTWAESRTDVVGVALVGSYARGAATPTSDVDLIILSNLPDALLVGDWPARFGDVQSSSIEDCGASKSRRIFYRHGLEIEFVLAAPNWTSLPLDSGTKSVLTDGVKVLYDPEQLFRSAKDAAGA